ncbi:hypothetical protein LZK75_17295 [Rhizobium leguminosarum]|nr:hypothetical protein LZK75_17295 [Rhizobium leguminosarum]
MRLLKVDPFDAIGRDELVDVDRFHRVERNGIQIVLKRWPDEERGLLEGLLAKLSIADAEGNPLPLTRDAIQGGFEWLARRIRLGSKFIKPPSIVLRSYQYYKFPDPPEAVLLNSFFLGDLAKATTLVGGGHAPHTLISTYRSPSLATARTLCPIVRR